MKKLSRAQLAIISGANNSICNGCPTQNHYGPGPGYDGTCENYFALPDYCRARNCVGVSIYCFEAM
ncbi:hypothetical protein [Chryseobacterium phosphatilyticum]|uniref:hypothetical protein n=1 Tax=Chryseobacterium phosphatilyticum TaxID=475075 RepID=UPI000F4F7769|nr:hypothetical protein [Chryseobacterium phosphatilyticum]